MYQVSQVKFYKIFLLQYPDNIARNKFSQHKLGSNEVNVYFEKKDYKKKEVKS